MLYKLFSATHRCMPCKILIHMLNQEFPKWEKYIEYVDADFMSKENRDLATKLKIMRLPTLADSEKIIKISSQPNLAVLQIKELCLIKE